MDDRQAVISIQKHEEQNQKRSVLLAKCDDGVRWENHECSSPSEAVAFLKTWSSRHLFFDKFRALEPFCWDLEKAARSGRLQDAFLAAEGRSSGSSLAASSLSSSLHLEGFFGSEVLESAMPY